MLPCAGRLLGCLQGFRYILGYPAHAPASRPNLLFCCRDKLDKTARELKSLFSPGSGSAGGPRGGGPGAAGMHP